MKTPLWANTPGAELFTQTEEVAAIAFLASVEASYITGSVLPVDAGYTA